MVGRTAAGGDPDADPVMQTRRQILTNPTTDIESTVPIVYSTTPSQLAFDHLAVMALTPAGSDPATTQTLRVTGGNAISVTWRGPEDVIVRKLAAAGEVAGNVTTDADVAKFTRDAGETVVQGGTRLSAGGRDYVRVSGTAATVTVNDDQIRASGSPANSYRVFAPQIVSSVLVNGATVTTCREEGYVLFPCAQVTTPAPPTPAALTSASGTPAAGTVGIPDADADTVPDSADACPNQPAATTTGCPAQAATRARCKINGPYPDKRCTPGAVFRTVSARQICRRGYGQRARNLSGATTKRVFVRYGITSARTYKIDHFVPLQLGGSNSLRNLFPQAAFPIPGFRQKDKLERALQRRVCAGRMTLKAAQTTIRKDWVVAYKRFVVAGRSISRSR